VKGFENAAKGLKSEAPTERSRLVKALRAAIASFALVTGGAALTPAEAQEIRKESKRSAEPAGTQKDPIGDLIRSDYASPNKRIGTSRQVSSWKTGVVVRDVGSKPSLDPKPGVLKGPYKDPEYRFSHNNTVAKYNLQKSSPVTPEILAANIRRTESQLLPGGALLKELDDPKLTRERLYGIIADVSRYGGLVDQTEAGIIPGHPDLNRYLLKETPRGLVVLKVPVRYANGEIGHKRCNGMRISFKEEKGKVRTAIATNRHCVQQPGTFTALDYNSWLVSREGSDFALLPIKDSPNQESAEFDERATARRGWFGKVDALSRYDGQVKFSTFVLPMTEPVLKILFPTRTFIEVDKNRLLKEYWYPSPPDQQSISIDGKGIVVDGQSGTPPVVLSGKDYIPFSPMHSIWSRGIECADDLRYVCTTINFTTSPAVFLDTVRSHSPKVWDALAEGQQPGPHRTIVLERKSFPN
jgi:hypothetical protein